jgi:hypothetical protein
MALHMAPLVIRVYDAPGYRGSLVVQDENLRLRWRWFAT